MSLQPQIIILPSIIKTELQLIKIELKSIMFINSLGLLKNMLMHQVLEGLSVKQLQQSQAYRSKLKHQEPIEQHKKEVSLRITFMTNYFSSEINEFKVMKLL